MHISAYIYAHLIIQIKPLKFVYNTDIPYISVKQHLLVTTIFLLMLKSPYTAPIVRSCSCLLLNRIASFVDN